MICDSTLEKPLRPGRPDTTSTSSLIPAGLLSTTRTSQTGSVIAEPAVKILLACADKATSAMLGMRIGDGDTGDYAIQTTSSAHCANEAIALGEVDVAIVDISDGQWIPELSPPREDDQPPFIALGNDPGQAQAAYDWGAVDFILRDASSVRIHRALARALDGFAPAAALLKSSTSTREYATRWIRATRDDELVFGALDDALFFQAERKVTRVVLKSGEACVHQGIGTIIHSLDPRQFWRIHRGTVINGHALRAVERDAAGRMSVLLRDCSEALTVSKRYEHMLCGEGLF